MATTALQKFLDQLSKNRNVQGFVNEFNRLSTELGKRGQDLNLRLTEEGEKTLQQAHDKIQQVVKAVGETQKQLDKEVDRAVDRIRSSAAKVEKGLEFYRKRALAQKARLEKLIKARSKKTATAARSTKKTAKKQAPKRTSKKTTRSTSKKA